MSSGAGEKARLIYVNWVKFATYRERICYMTYTHQRLPRFPPKLLAQELDDSLKAVGNSHPEEVLFHDWRVPDCFEAHDHCKLALSYPRTVYLWHC